MEMCFMKNVIYLAAALVSVAEQDHSSLSQWKTPNT